MKILIAYATTEGQTRKICRYCANTLIDLGHSTELLPVTEDVELDLGQYDAAILGASVHAGRYQREMVAFAKAHAHELNEIKTLFLSVSLAAAGTDAEERADLEAIATRFSEETGWRPGQIEQVAGAFRFSEYDFFKSWAMRWIAAQRDQTIRSMEDTEYTDWDVLRDVVTGWVG